MKQAAWRVLRSRSKRICSAVLLGLLGCTGCLHDTGGPAAPFGLSSAVRYTVTIEGAPSDAIAGLAERTLLTYRLRERGVGNRVNLLRRVRQDEARLTRLLRSQGHYTPAVTSDVSFPADDAAHVTFEVRPGPAYILTQHELAFEAMASDRLLELDAAELGSPVGDAARAAAVMQAEEAAVAALQSEGYPYAAYVKREGTADPDTATVKVTSTFASGPLAVFGPVRFVGLRTVQERYLLTYWTWDEGSRFDRRALGAYQRQLMATELFRAVSVRVPDEPPPANASPVALPVVVTAEEGPRRRVEAGVRYDTDLGLAGRASWRHRNLFGDNESLRVQADIGRVEQGVTVDVRKPQFRRSGQELAGNLNMVRTDDRVLAARTATGTIGLRRRLNSRWTIGLAGLVEFSAIDATDENVDARLIGAPASVAYDRTDQKLDPTTGQRLEIEAGPFVGKLAGRPVQFGTFGARASIYRPVDAGARYVVAARARVAAIAAKELDSVPATRRLYAGGGGSVRGYARSSVGPLGPDGRPTGGRSVLEVEAELRIRVGENYGVVPFVAAGLVSADTVPDGSEEVRAAAGVGVRYFSPAGPIRVDLAVPLNARHLDDAFAVYVSIGQAF